MLYISLKFRSKTSEKVLYPSQIPIRTLQVARKPARAKATGIPALALPDIRTFNYDDEKEEEGEEEEEDEDMVTRYRRKWWYC